MLLSIYKWKYFNSLFPLKAVRDIAYTRYPIVARIWSSALGLMTECARKGILHTIRNSIPTNMPNFDSNYGNHLDWHEKHNRTKYIASVFT